MKRDTGIHTGLSVFLREEEKERGGGLARACAVDRASSVCYNGDADRLCACFAWHEPWAEQSTLPCVFSRRHDNVCTLLDSARGVLGKSRPGSRTGWLHARITLAVAAKLCAFHRRGVIRARFVSRVRHSCRFHSRNPRTGMTTDTYATETMAGSSAPHCASGQACRTGYPGPSLRSVLQPHSIATSAAPQERGSEAGMRHCTRSTRQAPSACTWMSANVPPLPLHMKPGFTATTVAAGSSTSIPASTSHSCVNTHTCRETLRFRCNTIAERINSAQARTTRQSSNFRWAQHAIQATFTMPRQREAKKSRAPGTASHKIRRAPEGCGAVECTCEIALALGASRDGSNSTSGSCGNCRWRSCAKSRHAAAAGGKQG